MLEEIKYLEAKKIVDDYESQLLDKALVIKSLPNDRQIYKAAMNSNEPQNLQLNIGAVSGSLPCRCLKCSPNLFPNMRFNVCPICGNKRCPHASDHNYECTNSNDVGQTGSVYGGNDR